jgi:hypothetical protein
MYPAAEPVSKSIINIKVIPNSHDTMKYYNLLLMIIDKYNGDIPKYIAPIPRGLLNNCAC